MSGQDRDDSDGPRPGPEDAPTKREPRTPSRSTLPSVPAASQRSARPIWAPAEAPGEDDEPLSSAPPLIEIETSAHRRPLKPGEEPAPEVASKPKPSSRLGRYPITGRLGSGGIGDVVEVFDANLGRTIAAKILHDPSDAIVRRAFIFEARVLGHLAHPNIVPVHELGSDGAGRPYFTMRRIEGESLHDRLKRLTRDRGGPPALPELLAIYVKVCRALAHAHKRGVIHLDLKPANVMLGDGEGELRQVQVVDWGLARQISGRPEQLLDSSGKLGATMEVGAPAPEALANATHRVMGTPAYMPPEQARGDRDKLDQRADVYSLGAILYHILALVPPYVGHQADEVLAALDAGPPPPPRERNPQAQIPWELQEIVLKAMARKPADRYATVGALLQDIERFREGKSVGAARYGLLRRVRKGLLSPLTAAALLAIAAAAGGGWAIQHLQQQHQATSTRLTTTERDLAEEARQRREAEAALERARTQMGELLRGQGRLALGERRLLDAAIYAAAAREVDPALALPIPRPALILDDIQHPHRGRLPLLALSPDGGRIATAVRRRIRIAERNRPPRWLAGHSLPIRALDYLEDGRLVSIDESRLIIWSSEGERLIEQPLTVLGRQLACHERMIAVIGAGGLQLFDPISARPLESLEDAAGGPAPFTAVCLSRDGDILALGQGPRVTIYDLIARQRLTEVETEGGAVRAIAIDPDGQLLAIACGEGTIQLWSLSQGRVLRTLRGHRKQVTTLAFSQPAPNRQQLFSFARDGELRLWRPQTGELIQLIAPGEVAMTAFARPAGGGWIATGYADGGLRIWHESDGCGDPLELTVLQAQRISGMKLEDHALKPIADAPYARLRSLVALNLRKPTSRIGGQPTPPEKTPAE